MLRVRNLENNNGNPIVNQFIISSDNYIIFQSYESAIVLIDKDDAVHLSQDWDYSTTTGKYRNIFLRESTKKN